MLLNIELVEVVHKFVYKVLQYMPFDGMHEIPNSMYKIEKRGVTLYMRNPMDEALLVIDLRSNIKHHLKIVSNTTYIDFETHTSFINFDVGFNNEIKISDIQKLTDEEKFKLLISSNDNFILKNIEYNDYITNNELPVRLSSFYFSTICDESKGLLLIKNILKDWNK